jgi:hypothetical protein
MCCAVVAEIGNFRNCKPRSPPVVALDDHNLFNYSTRTLGPDLCLFVLKVCYVMVQLIPLPTQPPEGLPYHLLVSGQVSPLLCELLSHLKHLFSASLTL